MYYEVAQKHIARLVEKMKSKQNSINCQTLRLAYLGYKHEMLSAIRKSNKDIDLVSTIELHKTQELMEPLRDFFSSQNGF